MNIKEEYLIPKICTYPDTLPMPVMIPPDGTESAPYMPHDANCDSSKNGEDGSINAETRSLARSFPLDLCLWVALAPPPSAAF